jgi:cobyrinic acid a,c-diamide synthase
MYAADIAANESLKHSLKAAAERGTPVYAECGGLMYLGAGIRDLEGKEYPMTGVLPLSSQIDRPKLSLGYRTVEALADGPLLRKGEKARGHEFHWSVLRSPNSASPAYRIMEGDGRAEGFHIGSVLASYIHIHLGHSPGMAPRFVEVCGAFRDNGNAKIKYQKSKTQTKDQKR